MRMEALVLERKGVLAIREIDIKEELGPLDVRIAIHTVGVWERRSFLSAWRDRTIRS